MQSKRELTDPIFQKQHAQGTTWNCAWSELLWFSCSFYNKFNNSKLSTLLWLDIKLIIVAQKCCKLPFSTCSASLLALMLLLRLVAWWLHGKLLGTGLMSFILHQALGEWGTPILLHGAQAQHKWWWWWLQLTTEINGALQTLSTSAALTLKGTEYSQCWKLGWNW